MPQITEAQFVTATADVTVVGVTETVIATLTGVSPRYGTSPVLLQGWAQIAPGADQTSLAIAIRRTSLTGALVGEANAITFAAAASQRFNFSLLLVDTPGDVAGQVYVLTALQAGGVANGTSAQAAVIAIL